MSASSPIPNSNALKGVVSISQSSSFRHAFLQHLNRLAKLEHEVISNLRHQTDNEVLDTRSRAHLLGKSAWRIEVACDGELWQRAEDKRKREHKHTDSDSIRKVLHKTSKEIGCTPQTLYNNRRVSQLLEQAQIQNIFNLDELDQKGYYLVALNAVDPLRALARFAESKSKDRYFRVSQAARLLEKEGLTKKVATEKALSDSRQQFGLTAHGALSAHIAKARNLVLKQILNDCPSPEFRKNIWHPLLLDLDNALKELFDNDVGTAIKAAWRRGAHREDEMAAATGFPLDVVEQAMRYLCEDFILVPKPGTFRTWHLVGEQLPPELRGANFQPALAIDDEDDEDEEW